MKVTLSIKEVKDLALLCGLDVDSADFEDDDLETRVVILAHDKLYEEETKEVLHYNHIAYFEEYPEDGGSGLGDIVKRESFDPVEGEDSL